MISLCFSYCLVGYLDCVFLIWYIFVCLFRNDRAKAVEILAKDLKVFATFNEELYKEITQLLTLENFRWFLLCPWCNWILKAALYCFLVLYRENEQLSKYGDTKSARSIMYTELKKLIEANPLFREKLAFPSFKASRLRTLINQRLTTRGHFSFFSFSIEMS